MKQLSLFLFISLLLFSCREEEAAAPASLYEKEKFKNILVDFHITEAALSFHPDKPDSVSLVAYSTYLELFKKHKTTPEAFNENIQYYSGKPGELGEIMESVIDSLNVLNLGLQ